MNHRLTLRDNELMASRARELAQPLEGNELLNTATSQFVSVSLDQESYAFSALYVLCASNALAVATMPGAQPPLAGLTVYEGDILPVFHLRNLVGMPPRCDATCTWILVLGQPTAEIGLLVDRVATVAAVDTSELHPGWTEATSSPSELLISTTSEGVTIIDVEHLLADQRLVVNAGR